MTHELSPTRSGTPLNRRAAIYVRMSSNPQDHSIQHQIDALYIYAHNNGIEIVMVYADTGKSGLHLSGRDGLMSLLADVQAGTAAYEVVLVYDVSRWGRFQDIDESAHYEFLCRQAGVQVIYCAEDFASDGSPMYALMKGMKRIMAAEYSRELGVKVLLAQCSFSKMGYKQGGAAWVWPTKGANRPGRARQESVAVWRAQARSDRPCRAQARPRRGGCHRPADLWNVRDRRIDRYPNRDSIAFGRATQSHGQPMGHL